jgi:hypothetical protein
MTRKQGTIQLHDLTRAFPRPKIFGLSPGGYEDGWVEFDHIDGMYSFCVAYDGTGRELGIVHLSAWTPLEQCEEGWRVA